MTDYVAHLNDPTDNFRRREVMALADRLRTQASVVAGVIRWHSNNRVPPADCVALAKHIGLLVDVPTCTAARDKETMEAIRAYRAAQARRTPEEVAEQRAMARAAHGPGVAMVNCLTRERHTT